MGNDQLAVLKKLLGISEFDAKIAAINVEKRTLDAKRKEKQETRNAAKTESDRKTREYEERRGAYSREERRLKDAQQKLVDRRKALTTLGSYKLQVAAEREIEAAAKQLGAQEEQLIQVLEQIEVLEQGAREAQSAFTEADKAFQAIDKEIAETFATLDERANMYLLERNKLLPEIDEKSLEVYERVKQRYPMDPVVPFKQRTCGGCFMELGPQTTVEISRGKSLVRCRGCGRLLYLEEPAE